MPNGIVSNLAGKDVVILHRRYNVHPNLGQHPAICVTSGSHSRHTIPPACNTLFLNGEGDFHVSTNVVEGKGATGTVRAGVEAEVVVEAVP